MSRALDTLLAPLRQSPLLAEIGRQINRQLQEEQALRQKFYEEMSKEDKVEFINGEVIFHSPARNVHLDVTMNIAQLLRYYIFKPQLGELKVEKCLCVFPRNDYEPDIAFFSKEKAALFQVNTMKFPVPDLVVEVLSSSTEKWDRGIKREDYEAHGVKEYWIVDAEASVIEQYILEKDAYALRLKSGGGLLCSEAVTGFEVQASAFFDATASFQALHEMMAGVR